MFDRTVLSSTLDQLRAELVARGSDASQRLRTCFDDLRARVDAADAEWLFDRFADLARAVGLSPNGARHLRRIAAQGVNPSTRPFYAEMPVERPAGVAHRLPLDAALRALATGDGYMTWTWGYDPVDRVAWLSDAQRGCTEDDLECAHEVFRKALAELGLELKLGL